MNADNIFQHLKNEDWRTKNNADDVWDILDVLGYEESVFGFLSELKSIPADSKLFNAYVSFLPTGESDEHVQIHFADRSVLSLEKGEWKTSAVTKEGTLLVPRGA